MRRRTNLFLTLQRTVVAAVVGGGLGSAAAQAQTTMQTPMQTPMQAPSQMSVPVASPCGVPAWPNPAVGTALSRLTPQGPAIVFNPIYFENLGPSVGPALFRWMLAHECAHHQAGDVGAGMTHPVEYLQNTPQIELRADCASAKYLASTGDREALAVAIAFWSKSGNNPTGPNYPTGLQRARTLQACGG